MKKRTAIIITVTILAAAAIIWFAIPKKETATIETAVPEISDIKRFVTATGTVEPVTLVEVGTQVSGIITKLYADYNDIVTEGQLIAEMDKETLEADLASSEAELESCENEYEYQSKLYERSKTLYEKGLISDSEYDAALYNYKRSKAAYDKSKAAMVKVKRNLGYAEITSPINGVIISKDVEEGQTVAAGFSTPTLFTIAKDLTKMQIIADVDEADIGQVKTGQKVSFYVDAYPDDTFYGVVEQVRLEGIEESNVITYEVVVSADNPDLKLKPGLTANITIYTMIKENIRTIPSKAFSFRPLPGLFEEAGLEVDDAGKMPEPGKDMPEGIRPGEGMPLPEEMAQNDESNTQKAILWVLKNGKVERRQVVKGVSESDKTEIISGLEASDTVITSISLNKAKETDMPMPSERSPFMPGPRGGNNNGNKK